MTEAPELLEPGERQLATRPHGNGDLAAPTAGAVSLLPVQQMKTVLAEYDDRRAAFRQWLLSQLEKGVHYGVVPGTEPKQDSAGNYVDFKGNIIRRDQWRPEKPSLYKAGADFLCDLLMLDPTFSPDLEAWKMLGAKEGTVVICCRLLCRGDSPFFPGREKGEVIGEGRGAGVVGDKKRDANAALKVAQKSSKVDAVINALGLSDLFTQDREDPPPKPAPDSDPKQPAVPTRAERAAQTTTVNATALNELFAAWRERAGKPKGTLDEFVLWAADVLKHEEPALLKSPRNWTAAAVQRCHEVMQ